MFMRPTSYFLETKRSAVGSFCGAMLYISAVYAAVRLSVCHVRVEDLLCQNAQPHYAGRVAVPPGVSQIFPPHEKIPRCEFYACSGGLLLGS